jgi:hypothetical protein
MRLFYPAPLSFRLRRNVTARRVTVVRSGAESVRLINVSTDAIKPSAVRNGNLDAVRSVRLVWMAASAQRAWPTAPPAFQRCVLDPQGQTATSAQAYLAGRLVLDMERHLRNVVTAIGIMFVRHGWPEPDRDGHHATLRRPECTKSRSGCHSSTAGGIRRLVSRSMGRQLLMWQAHRARNEAAPDSTQPPSRVSFGCQAARLRLQPLVELSEVPERRASNRISPLLRP